MLADITLFAVAVDRIGIAFIHDRGAFGSIGIERLHGLHFHAGGVGHRGVDGVGAQVIGFQFGRAGGAQIRRQSGAFQVHFRIIGSRSRHRASGKTAHAGFRTVRRIERYRVAGGSFAFKRSRIARIGGQRLAGQAVKINAEPMKKTV